MTIFFLFHQLKNCLSMKFKSKVLNILFALIAKTNLEAPYFEYNCFELYTIFSKTKQWKYFLNAYEVISNF